MTIAAKGAVAGESGGGFVEAVRRAAKNGRTRLIKPVWDDYDRLEAHRWANRFVAMTSLVSLRAEASVHFVLPLGHLPEGGELEIDTRYGSGCWLHAPGVDPDDPIDVMSLAFEGDGATALLAGLILPEVVRGRRFRTVRGWRRLTKSYRADRFRYHAGPDGLHVSFVVELEAYR